MHQVFEFVAAHSDLTVAFLVILGGLGWTFIAGGTFGGGVDPSEATRLINHDDALVLDVRSEDEFKGGHILNAVHIPESSVKDSLSRLEKYRNRPLIVVCRSGQRAQATVSLLRKSGFEKVHTLGGGLSAWEDANLPLTTK